MLGNGESSRSLHERAKEHWADAVKEVDECHRMEHEHAAHRGEGGNPSCVWLVGADSKKNEEQNGSLYTIRSGVSVSHGIQLFSTSQGGPFNTTPSKKRKFHQPWGAWGRGVDSEYASLSKNQRYGKTIL